MREWLRDARIRQRLTENGKRQKKMDVSLAIRLGNVLGMSLQEIVAAEGGGE